MGNKNKNCILSFMKKAELLDFIHAYDKYVIKCSEEGFERCPVCIHEFYENEWMMREDEAKE